MKPAFPGFRQTSTIASVLLLLTAHFNLQARQYYVSPTGADTDSGTIGKPFQHIQKVADIMQPGDTATINSLIISMASPLAFYGEVVSCLGKTVSVFSGNGSSKVNLTPGLYLVRMHCGKASRSQLTAIVK